MMNSTDVMKVIEDIAATSSRREKEDILARFIHDPTMQKVLKYTYDPFITYGITPPKVKAEGTLAFNADSTYVWLTLDALAGRRLTGHAATDGIADAMLEMEPETAKLFFRIIAKDLRAGFTANTINKVAPGLIPVFNVMLAHKFEEKRIAAWPVAVEPKYDGYRIIAVDKSGSIEFLTRTGKPYTSIDSLGQELADTIRRAHDTLKGSKIDDAGKWLEMFEDGLVLDGEVMAGSFEETGALRRKDEEVSDARIVFFDVISQPMFEGKQKADMSYRERRQFLEFILKHRQSNAIRHSPRYIANSHADVMKFYEAFREDGLEGAIVKPFDGLYEKKRSYAWMKIKPEESEDLRIIGAFEGTGKYEGMLGGLEVDREGVVVNVGGGFSDEERRVLWELYKHDTRLAGTGFATPEDFAGLGCKLLGRMIEVEFHEVTPDGSLRHPRYVRFRDDKDEHAKAA